MHTKKKEFPPAKTKRVTIRMTEVLYEVLTKNAKLANLPLTEYIRELITGKNPPVKYEIVYNSPEILKIFRDLGYMSGNLNQIARQLNQGGKISKGLGEEIRGSITEIRHLREEVKGLTGEYCGDSYKHSDT